MAKKAAPNLFDLSGEGITVSYSTTSIDGKPRFTYKKGRQSLSFSGKDITSLDIGIGTLVSVLIASTPDKDSTTFSIVLPAIILPDSNRQAFRTIGITTTTRTTIAGPPPGAQQTYKAVALRGVAQSVDF
jgi:hypothetical protein